MRPRNRAVALFAALAMLGAFASIGCEPPPPVGGNYRFADEFNAATLNTHAWQPNWLAGNNTTVTKPVNGAELSCYDPANVSEPGDGYLHLRLAHRTCRASNGTTYAYASGLVNTHNGFTFTTGYLEVRAKAAGTTAITNWPAIWTDGTGTWPSTGESDIFEGLGGKACWHYHSPAGGPGGCAAGNFTGWHTFAERVTSDTTTYIYDGTTVGTVANVHAPHFIILNLGAGSFGGATVAPAELLVDYVRVSA